ncbi:MAG: hypothetical protein EOR72_21020 [Mesorhizobium sp.]|nr:MAG: hypothetical protein EOR72_21020 [Mesorhizobium sp.]
MDNHSDRAMWKPILTAPYFCMLELAVINEDGEHRLVFPCRRVVDGWQDARSGRQVEVCPTHWREWMMSERQQLHEGADWTDIYKQTGEPPEAELLAGPWTDS